MNTAASPLIGSSDGLALVEKTRLAICHLAKVALTLHSETAAIYGRDAGLAEVAFPRDVALLDALGRHLHEAAALMDEDDWCLEVLQSARRMANAASDPRP